MMERMVLEEQGSKVLNRFVQSDNWGMVGRTDSFFFTAMLQTHRKPKQSYRCYWKTKKF